MAGSQISTSVTILDSLLGFQAISLTNFATSAQSLVAAGSKIEIGSAFFTFDNNETPNASSWTAVGTGNTAYFALVPAGTAGSQTVTAEYTDTAPTWIDSKQGWYMSAASLTRCVGGVVKISPTQYDNTFILTNIQHANPVSDETLVRSMIIDLGTWNMDTNASSPSIGNLGPLGLTIAQITGVEAIIYSDSGTGYDFAATSDYGTTTANTYIQIGPAVAITLHRATGGFFDSADFNATASSRGRVTIRYTLI